MEDWLGEVNVSEVARALGSVASTGLTPGGSVHCSLAWVHETSQLGSATLVHLGVLDPTLRHRHPPDLLGTEDPKLDPLHLLHRRLLVIGDDRRHFGSVVTTLNSGKQRMVQSRDLLTTSYHFNRQFRNVNIWTLAKRGVDGTPF